MPKPELLRYLPLSRLQVALAGFSLMACMIGISLLAVEVLNQIEHDSSSKSDNVQWALSQTEMELIRLVIAADAAQLGRGDLDEVRLRFDIFYSRLSTMDKGRAFQKLREFPAFSASLARLESFMASQVKMLDGPDPVLLSDLGQLSSEARAHIGDARTLALTGVQAFAVISDNQRRDAARTLILAGLLTTALVTSLVGLLFLLLRLYRSNRLRSAENLETLSRLDSVVDTALEALISVDGAGRIVDYNPAAHTTFGFDRAEAIGADLASLINAVSEGQPLFRHGAAPKIDGHGRVRILARHKDGHVFPAEVSISRTISGDSPLYVAFLRDLSVQTAAENALVAARDEALAGEKAKADLLVVMSHEIRTPLNGMIGTIELLDATDLQPHQREYLRIMDASGKLLMHHVNDVLDIARLDSGKVPFHPVAVDLANLIQEVLENQMPASRDNGNILIFEPPPDGRNVVIGDGAQLRQVLLNLVGNAVKFTRNGKIEVGFRHLGAIGPTEFRVTDTGIGIPEADLGRIFDDFVTLDASYARRASGTGLGLGIVKRIVAQMGGALRVESRMTQGSTFVITLPMQIAQIIHLTRRVPLTKPVQPVSAGAARTLVVEDNDFNRLIVREMLVAEGHEVVEAHDGAEGIQRAEAERFDLILMDISMPRVDGLQAANAILQGTGASLSATIVAMTAHALQEETAKFRAVGMDLVLTKPITRDALKSVLARAVGTVSPASPAVVGLIDRSVLLALADDLGIERANQLTQKFLTESGQIVQRILEQVAGTGPDQATMGELHRLHGTSGLFGATAMQMVLSEAETLWKSGAADDTGRILTDLAALWQRTRDAFHEAVALAQPSSLR
ncbi:MAG: ATP-binding protein [bacterium]